MSWVGGTQIGDRVSNDNAQIFYPRKVNKGAVAHTKGLVVQKDASGNLIVAPTTGAKRPFYICYEDSLTTDKRQHVWDQTGPWVVLQTTTILVPNDRVKPSTTVAGKIEKFIEGTDAEALAIGIYLGTIDLGADLLSGDVYQDSADALDLCVIDFRVT
jgi:hypothetical protein